MLPGRVVEAENQGDVGISLSGGVGQAFSESHSIDRFRKGHGPALEDLFPKALLLYKKLGLVKPGCPALDGFKVKHNEALDENRKFTHFRA